MSHHASNLLPGSTALGVFRPFAPARLLLGWLRIFAGLVFVAHLTVAAASGPTEYQVKAAFVFNFVKFTDWPAAAFTNATAPIVIGVVSDDPFNQTLDELLKGEVVSGRPLVVKQFQPGEDVSACQVLFLGRSEKASLHMILANVKNKPVLTISDLGKFCEQGGMVNLALSAGNTVKPEINPAAARLAGVQISSRLLNLPSVRLVKTEP